MYSTLCMSGKRYNSYLNFTPRFFIPLRFVLIKFQFCSMSKLVNKFYTWRENSVFLLSLIPSSICLETCVPCKSQDRMVHTYVHARSQPKWMVHTFVRCLKSSKFIEHVSTCVSTCFQLSEHCEQGATARSAVCPWRDSRSTTPSTSQLWIYLSHEHSVCAKRFLRYNLIIYIRVGKHTTFYRLLCGWPCQTIHKYVQYFVLI